MPFLEGPQSGPQSGCEAQSVSLGMDQSRSPAGRRRVWRVLNGAAGPGLALPGVVASLLGAPSLPRELKSLGLRRGVHEDRLRHFPDQQPARPSIPLEMQSSGQ